MQLIWIVLLTSAWWCENWALGNTPCADLQNTLGSIMSHLNKSIHEMYPYYDQKRDIPRAKSKFHRIPCLKSYYRHYQFLKMIHAVLSLWFSCYVSSEKLDCNFPDLSLFYMKKWPSVCERILPSRLLFCWPTFPPCISIDIQALP